MDNNYFVTIDGVKVFEGTYNECQEFALYECEQAQIFLVDESGNTEEIKDWI